MRFDDRVATVLAQPADGDSARAAMWRQLVDLLAQSPLADGDVVRDAVMRLRGWRGVIPASVRRSAAVGVSGRPLPVGLVRFFADDAAAVAAPVLTTVQLSPAVWIALIPTLSPVSRSLIRHRRDLDPSVERALASYGASDHVIAAPPAVVESAVEADHHTPQISELVARIEAFRRDRDERGDPMAASAPATLEIADKFRFETGSDGTILWCDAEPRGAIVGLSVADIMPTRDHGVDGHAAGAFRQRAPYRDARFTVPGEGGLTGEWRISAVPFFDVGNGRFVGFRGAGRRPRSDETAQAAGFYGSSLPADSLRQLAHEIRTPLNAIIGFAEMIDRQILGPAAADYRGRAGGILIEARRLLGAVDDLDVAARLDARALTLDRGRVDGPALLARLCESIDELTRDRGVALRLSIARDLPPIDADEVSLERMFGRLLTATVGLAAREEPLDVSLDLAADDRVRFAVDRPAVLAGRDERALLDPGYSPDGDWPEAPVLGLGFALRLVRGLAEAAGGRLLIEDERFTLLLNAAQDEDARIEESGRGPVG